MKSENSNRFIKTTCYALRCIIAYVLTYLFGSDSSCQVLLRYGNEVQMKEWLVPLLEGKIRSGFAMTEPQVASSDATNIECSIKR